MGDPVALGDPAGWVLRVLLPGVVLTVAVVGGYVLGRHEERRVQREADADRPEARRRLDGEWRSWW